MNGSIGYAATRFSSPTSVSPAFSPTDVAVLRLDNLGDAILTSGLLSALRKAWPASYITVFCSMVSAQYFGRLPQINRVIPLPVVAPDECGSSIADQCFRRFRELYARKFDLLINPRFAPDNYGASRYALDSEAAVRIAFRQTQFLGNIDPNPAYTELVDIPAPLEHPAFVGRHILARLGLPHEMPFPSIMIGTRAREVAESALPNDRYIAFGIGAAERYRIWPAENFSALGTVLAQRGYGIVLIGSEQERTFADQISSSLGPSAIDLVGKLSIEESAAAIKRCAIFVGNDSGPKHMAAAAGRPVVEIVPYGARTPGFPYHRIFTPVGVPAVRVGPEGAFDVSSTRAGLAIASIRVDQVLAGVEEIERQL